MLTSVDLIMDEVVECGEASADLRELRRSAHRASELAVRLMVVARNQSPDPGKVDLGAHLRALLPDMAASLGPHVQLELNVLPGLPPVHMDESQLGDALTEIVRNASDAMGPTGTVRIGAFIDDTVPAGCVRLVVEDTGPGMSETVRDRAFRPFFSTRNRGESGGLGLTVVHSIMAQAGGVVTLESAHGAGTRVVMDLPKMAVLHLDGNGLAGSVIVVGSDQGEAAVLAQLLRDRGHLVRFTTNASGGLQALSVASGQGEFVVVEASDENLQFVRLLARDWAHLDVVWLGRADPRLPPAVTVLDNIPVYCVVDELRKLAAA
jgi:anti-sigma regulatory factor (Ser/Thr protein kinase)